MKQLSIYKKYNKNYTHKIQLLESQNGKPYLIIKNIAFATYEDNCIGSPLTVGDAKKMFKWLKEYLYGDYYQSDIK